MKNLAICVFFSSICAEEQVSSAMLYQAPFDPKELLVVGVNADNARCRLQKAVDDHYPDFKVITDSIKNYREHTREFMGKEEKIAFNLIKTNYIPSDDKFVDVGSATCELILEGENLDDRAPGTTLFAFAPAHLVLEEKDFEKLNDKNVHEGTAGLVQADLAGRALSYRYYLKTLHPKRFAKLVKGDVIYSYRQFQRGPKKDIDHFSSFYNDSILLEIPFNKNVTISTLTKAMQKNQKGAELGDIFPINDADDLQFMGENFVKVEIGPSSGYMVCPGIPLGNNVDSRPQLFHAQFVVTDWLVLYIF